MKLIPLSKGKVAMVDDEDFERLSKLSWHVMPAPYTLYAAAWCIHDGRRIKNTMHRFLMNLWPGDKSVVDHIDHDGLNNQKENLKVCTQKNNLCNNIRYRPKKHDLPKGVRRWHGKFVAMISINGRNKYLGIFPTKEEAAACYTAASEKRNRDYTAA